ncbi:hypothetical protein QSJ18_15985 [Gordonia sp. ABSL1-1]|uniref:hypothetical protein n=1 Tax=Gordonia sp. ABSL1-1 TaxID=3053923 RepID=UPI0025740D33|nr:hypothetical protein [Gordonia sp. ABSL1-1]MDL9938253.1 hypothetical protein [Gordonia sp. ABSL1-1]
MSTTPDDFRQVAIHVAISVGFTLGVVIVAIASAAPLSTALIAAAPIVALIGALSILVRTYRVWRAGGAWQVWQGGAWFLLTFFVMIMFGAAPALMT